MKIARFEDIESWKEARLLVAEVYRQLESCRDRSFKDQIQRASVSIMSNIAEGFDRGTNKELPGQPGFCPDFRALYNDQQPLERLHPLFEEFRSKSLTNLEH